MSPQTLFSLYYLLTPFPKTTSMLTWRVPHDQLTKKQTFGPYLEIILHDMLANTSDNYILKAPLWRGHEGKL